MLQALSLAFGQLSDPRIQKYILLSIGVALAVFAGLMAGACKPKASDNGVRYVAVKDGLNMREEPSPTGKKMLTIPYRQEVQKLEEKPESFTIDKTEGKWTKVTWKDKQGWVFGGFLSSPSVATQTENENNSSGNSVAERFKTLSFSTGFVNKQSGAAIYGQELGCDDATVSNVEISQSGVSYDAKYQKCPGSRGNCGVCRQTNKTCRISAEAILATAPGGTLKDSDIICN